MLDKVESGESACTDEVIESELLRKKSKNHQLSCNLQFSSRLVGSDSRDSKDGL
jgi:hypothetical protein